MATYVIGDVQGCLDELKLLLKKINFNKNNDQLIFAGDIINKGPKSLETINFIMSLQKSARLVLGNHEILFLNISYNHSSSKNKNTFGDILKSPNLKKIQQWLCDQNILIKIKNNFITHAGIPHIWSPKAALKRANEIEFVLKNKATRKLLLTNLFNYNKIKTWNENLKSVERWLCILNYFTRMRAVGKNAKLDFEFSSTDKNIPNGLAPWFKLKHKNFKPENKIIFGHWSALQGLTNDKNIIALDTGCVFGNKLTCYCLEEQKTYNVNSIKSYMEI